MVCVCVAAIYTAVEEIILFSNKPQLCRHSYTICYQSWIKDWSNSHPHLMVDFCPRLTAPMRSVLRTRLSVCWTDYFLVPSSPQTVGVGTMGRVDRVDREMYSIELPIE